jgi:enoyl-CoA hydratase/carnithine racemase
LNSKPVTVQYELRDAVAWVTMDRPQAMNASNAPMKAELIAALAQANVNPAIGAIVLTGNGRAFCAGGDRKEPPPATLDAYRSSLRLQQDVCSALWNSSKPVIAAVNGHAIGGGLEMAVVCDIRVAASSAAFSTPVCRIGSISTGGLHDQLARIVGAGRALHLLLSGDTIDAQEAHAIGLVSLVHADVDLADAAQRLAARIASFDVGSVVATRRAMRDASRPAFDAALDVEERLAVQLRANA